MTFSVKGVFDELEKKILNINGKIYRMNSYNCFVVLQGAYAPTLGKCDLDIFLRSENPIAVRERREDDIFLVKKNQLMLVPVADCQFPQEPILFSVDPKSTAAVTQQVTKILNKVCGFTPKL